MNMSLPNKWIKNTPSTLQNENKIHLNRSIVSGNNFNNPWSINNFCISLALFDYSNNPSLMTFLFSQFGTKFRSLKTTTYKESSPSRFNTRAGNKIHTCSRGKAISKPPDISGAFPCISPNVFPHAFAIFCIL